MKKLILLIPVLSVCVLALSSCTTVVKEPGSATTTTTHSESMQPVPATTSTSVTRQTGGGY